MATASNGEVEKLSSVDRKRVVSALEAQLKSLARAEKATTLVDVAFALQKEQQETVILLQRFRAAGV